MQTNRTFLRVSIIATDEGNELVGQIDSPAFLGAEHNDNRVILWLDPAKLELPDIDAWLSYSFGAPVTALEIEHVPAHDWLQQWRASLEPITIAGRVTIMPTMIDAEAAHNGIVIFLEPKMAFGTGHHATTQLCIEFLTEAIAPGQHWIDLGTGSGLLAIVAAKLGAARVLALDCDRDAIDEASENIDVNGCADRIDVRLADIVSEELPPSDGIVANLHSELLLQLSSRIVAALRPGGIAIVSGILSSQSKEVETQFVRSGFSRYAKRERGEWVALRLRRS